MEEYEYQVVIYKHGDNFHIRTFSTTDPSQAEDIAFEIASRLFPEAEFDIEVTNIGTL